MADIEAYKDKFSDSGRRVLEAALDDSRMREQNFVSVGHILHSLADEESDLFNATMRDLSVDPRSVKLLIEKRVDSAGEHAGKGFRIAPETTDLFKRAMDRARSQGRRVIDASDIFYVLSHDERSVLNDILQIWELVMKNCPRPRGLAFGNARKRKTGCARNTNCLRI